MAAMLIIASLYHAAALTIPAFAKIAYPATYPPLRHIAFILIDATAACLFLIRPRWLIWPYLILTAQVLQGHGARAMQTWRQNHQMNRVDLAVVAATLYGLTILYLNRRAIRSAVS